MIITDSQVHIWELDRPDRPWPAGRFLPAWGMRPFSEGDLLREMERAGVERAILVPPSFEGDRNDLCLAAAARHPLRFAVMGRLAVDDPASSSLLERWRRNPGALGLRFTFFIPPQRKWLYDGTADWLWSAAERAGLPLMILPEPAELPQFARIAERHPELRLVIDHLAVAGHIEGNRDDRAFAHLPALLALAKVPNIAVKASGIPEYSTEPYPYRNLHRYIASVVAEFGPRRVFWGSDLTRLPCSYRECVTMFTEEMPFLSSDDREWIMGRAISEWLRWPAGTAGAAGAR